MSERGHPNRVPVRNTGDLADINVFLANGTWEQCQNIQLNGFFHEEEESTGKLTASVYNGQAQGASGSRRLTIELYPLPYRQEVEQNSVKRDTYQFQILLFVRWVKQFLSLETIPSTINLQHELPDCFIKRTLELLALPTDQKNRQFLSFPIEDEENKNQMRQLFNLVKSDKQESQFDLEQFFIDLKDKGILKLIKEMEIVSKLSVDEESKSDSSTVELDYSKMNLLLAIGTYFATLPAVKGCETFLQPSRLRLGSSFQSRSASSSPTSTWDRIKMRPRSNSSVRGRVNMSGDLKQRLLTVQQELAAPKNGTSERTRLWNRFFEKNRSRSADGSTKRKSRFRRLSFKN